MKRLPLETYSIPPGTPQPYGSPTPPAETPKDSDLNIDELMRTGLRAVYGILRSCLAESLKPDPSRQAVQNLESAMKILQVLKEQEAELLDKMSDEDLEKLGK
jgi:hypothetical protein